MAEKKKMSPWDVGCNPHKSLKKEEWEGAGFYQVKDATRVERNDRINIQREFDTQQARTQSHGPQIFQMNLANMSASGGYVRLKFSHRRTENITENPQAQSPAARRSLEGMDPRSQSLVAIKHSVKVPTEKWDLSQTTSHDVAWLQASPARASALQLDSPTNLGGSALMSPSHAVTDPWLRATPTPSPILAATLSATTPTNSRVLGRFLSQPALPKAAADDPIHQEQGKLNDHIGCYSRTPWGRPRHTCDVSTYAEIVKAQQGKNPFARNETVDPLYAALPQSIRQRPGWK